MRNKLSKRKKQKSEADLFAIKNMDLLALDHMHKDVAVPLSFYLFKKQEKRKIKLLFFFIYNLINVYNIL